MKDILWSISMTKLSENNLRVSVGPFYIMMAFYIFVLFVIGIGMKERIGVIEIIVILGLLLFIVFFTIFILRNDLENRHLNKQRDKLKLVESEKVAVKTTISDNTVDSETETIKELPTKEDIEPNQDVSEQPSKTFSDYIHHENRDALMERLHELLNRQNSGIHVAKVLEALQKKNYLVKRSYTTPMVIKEFDIQCSEEAINKYLNKGKIEQAEIQQIMDMLP